MSESTLRPGQKVTLTGTVESIPGPCNEGCAYVLIDGDYDGSSVRSFPYAALTPVVEPEPQWEPGQRVQLTGVRGDVRELLHAVIGEDERHVWINTKTGFDALPAYVSESWREGRVEVVYRKEADK